MNVVIIGAGQAGLSLSYCLSEMGIEHTVLEQGRIGESWRSARWDSFCLVIPNWSVRLAGWPYGGPAPDDFMNRDEILAHLEAYARSFSAPVETGVCVTRVTRSGKGFVVEADGENRRADTVVIATGTHRRPHTPPLSQRVPSSVFQLHAVGYRSPAVLPVGAVLVVGSGQSGTQIAEELLEAGRAVYLSTSKVGRLPRRYRGVDAIEWQRQIGFLDREAEALDSPAHRFRPDPHLSGRGGGHTINLWDFAERGITLLGRLSGIAGTTLSFADDLEENLRFADAAAANFTSGVDAHIDSNNIAAPFADETNSDLGVSDCQHVPWTPRSLACDAADIRTIVWATGFRHDFSWVQVPVFDDFGYPRQRRGRTAVSGLHFIGLNYVDRRGSGILYGVGEDAERLAAVIAEEAASS